MKQMNLRQIKCRTGNFLTTGRQHREILHNAAFVDDISDLPPIEKVGRIANLMPFHIRKSKHSEAHKKLSS